MGPKRKAKSNKLNQIIGDEDESGDEDSTAVEAPATDPGITSDELKEILEQVISEKLSNVEEKLVMKICELKEDVAATRNIAEKALDLAKQN